MTSESESSIPKLVNRRLALVLLSVFGTGASFYLLLSVVPLYATSLGAGAIGAGTVTGALMFSTVITEMATPWLLSRFGYRPVFAAGVLLLGLPTLGLPAATSMVAILAISLARGIGLAVMFVTSGALVAMLVAAERRGEGVAIMGLVSLAPSVTGLPLGLWLAGHVGYDFVFIAAALAALTSLVALPALPNRASEAEGSIGLKTIWRTPAQIRPATVFVATTLAAGAVVTFIPLAPTGQSASFAALALFIQAATSALARWWAGRYGDRHGAQRLLVPAVLLAAAGVFSLVLIASPIAVVVGMLLFGTGFGIVQNATLALMFERARASSYGAVSALWSVAYDAGLGFGATGFGVVASGTGYPLAFAVTAALTLCAIGPALVDRTRTKTMSAGGAGREDGRLQS